MARPRLRDYLQPDEEVVREEGRHPLSIMDDALLAFALAVGVGIGLTIFLDANLRRPGPAIALLWAALAFGFLAYVTPRAIRVWTSQYALTHQRVYQSHGRLRFHLAQTTYDRITDLHVHQGFFGRFLGFGTVIAQTAGAGIALAGVRHPFEMKADLESARVRFIEALIGAHRVQRRAPTAEPASTAPEVGPSGATLWTGRPTPASFLSNLIGAAVVFVLAVASLGLFAVDVPSTFRFFPVVLMVMGGLVLLRIWVRYRFTRFEVTGLGLAVSFGWLSRNRIETTFEKITDVTTHESLWGRLLGFGDITANTAGVTVAPIHFYGVGRPLEIKELIERARARRRTGAAA